MSEILQIMSETRIVLVVTADTPQEALTICRNLVADGIPIAEITLRTSAAEAAIRLVSTELPKLCLGAGTVLSAAQAAAAISAGARFLVSPGFDAELVTYCQQREIPIIPGCATPTELMQAIRYSLNVVKLFPIEPLGGIAYLKAVAQVFPTLRFVPTGGINALNFEQYLQHPQVLAVGGSWVVRNKEVK